MNKNWLEEAWAKQTQTLKAIQEGGCGCIQCIEKKGHTAMHFVVCPICGNKRCPKANNHIHACTGSNEPGQKGSAYE